MSRTSAIRTSIIWAAVTAATHTSGDRGKALASDYVGPNGGRWRDASSWRPAGVPVGSGSAANVSLAPDGNFSLLMDFRYSEQTWLAWVTIDSSTSSMVTVNAISDLLTGIETIGDSGRGTYSQSTATNSVSGSLYLGNLAGSSGTYNLSSSGSLNVFSSEYVGYAGKGVFTQSGGGNYVEGDLNSKLHLGELAGSSGSYALSGTGGLYVSGSEIIGSAGTGLFTQTGGSQQRQWL